MFLPYWPKAVFKNQNIDRLALLKQALTKLHNPQKDLHNIIHIAGTNGKGSTAHFLQKMLQESGKTANLFSSPHLLHYNECFSLNGEKIPDKDLNLIIETVRLALPETTDITLFEASFLFALLAFKENPADYNIFETGLGGRIDPTNLLENKLFTIFTPISLDHQEFLGPNIEAITLEKAYIIQENCVNIIAAQPQISLGILKEFSNNFNGKTICYEENYDFFLENDKFNFVDIESEQIYEFALPTLKGKHQLSNLATSLACLKEIVDLNDKHLEINKAITETKFANRLQKMSHPQLNETKFKNCEIWCDGAHNPSGAKAISSWLKEQQKKYTFLLYGRTSQKDHQLFLQEFADSVDEIIFFEIESEHSPCRTNEFNSFLKQKTLKNHIKLEDNLSSAISYCFAQKQADFRIIMCGSLYIFRDYQKFF